MADLTRRQIAMMADEVGITDHAAAVRLVRRAFEVFLSASAALAADGPAAPEGHQPAPPAAGEVGELVALLRYEAREADLDLMTAEQCHRAADLLAQCCPSPVPVAERWPEFSDCDRADDRVWCFSPELSHWKLSRIARTVHSHWLPAHALPLPQLPQQETTNG